MNILNYLLLCSFFAYGIFTLQRPGFLLEGLRSFWKRFPKGIHEPLYSCGVCVASIWGGLAFLYVSACDYLQLPVVCFLPVVLPAGAGVTAVLDRAVKAFEKIYGYKAPPDPAAPAPKNWDYLLPFDSLRAQIINSFVSATLASGRKLIEIGGYHPEWNHANYQAYNSRNVFTEAALSSLKPHKYDLVLLGLLYDGDLKTLRKAVLHANTVIIEYSDDGLSRQQVDWITEGLNVRLLIPEYEMSTDPCAAPAVCGSTNRRRILVIRNESPFVKQKFCYI